MTASIARVLNALGLLAVSLILIAAFADQILFGDLPCPLCLLERVGFVGAAFGLALNVKFGPRPSHYAITMLSAIFGAVIAGRHVLLHIVPGTGTYGDAILGLHFYTWALVMYSLIIFGCAVMLVFDLQFISAGQRGQNQTQSLVEVPFALQFGFAMVVLAALLALGNGISTVLECAGGLCPDNPVSYLLLPSR
jgi:disulfide bond formation protein DsbB